MFKKNKIKIKYFKNDNKTVKKKRKIKDKMNNKRSKIRNWKNVSIVKLLIKFK